jgi:hypothetical protein
MAKRLSDDEIMDYTFNRVFGDLDGIRSGSMFSSEKDAAQGAAPNAGTPGIEGIDISIKPKMAAAAENERPDDLDGNLGEDEDDRLKGISKMSPLMAQLHGER